MSYGSSRITRVDVDRIAETVSESLRGLDVGRRVATATSASTCATAAASSRRCTVARGARPTSTCGV